MKKKTLHQPHTQAVLILSRSLREITAKGWQDSYFLLISVSVTPFKDTFRLTRVGMKEPEAFSRVEDTALCTAQGPVSISVGTAFK